MKKMLLFLFISCMMSVQISAQDLRPAMVPGMESIFGGCKLNDNTLFLSGYRQGVYKSTDGGNTWMEKYINDSENEGRGISFGSASTGYSVSDGGTMLKSVDGGETWNRIDGPDTTLVLLAVNFFDDNNGFVLATKSSTSTLFKTTDGGTSWTTAVTASGSLVDMDFYSATKGILVGGGTGTQGMLLYYTTDGNSWTKAPMPTIPSGYAYTKLNLHNVRYVNENLAYGCGWGSTVGMQPTLFVKTTDGGATWTYLDQTDQNKLYVNMYKLYFKDELNGIAAGFNSYPGLILAKTTDGGVNWIPQTIAPAAFTPKAILANGDKIVMAGSGGNVIISTDFGVSWIYKSSVAKSTLYDIEIQNNKIYAAGYESNFYKSLDNGVTFSSSPFSMGNVCLRPNDISFVNENTGFAALMYGQALKTTNGGISWNEIIPDSNIPNRSNDGVHFFNENTGIIVGTSAQNLDVIYKTTDGGQTWIKKEGTVFRPLNCVAFGDENHGAIAGNFGNILYTTDQGQNWAPAVLNITGTPNIKEIDFVDAQNGIAVGDRIILRTSNGGAEWTPVIVSFLDKTLLTVKYKNANEVYAGGDKYILKSVDAGSTWTIISDTAFHRINKVQAVNIDDAGYLWVGLSTGLILTNSPVNGVNDESLDPNSFALEQNYPNPFNPSTTIAFNLSERGFVTIKLFDVLGREVKEIFKGEKDAGKHSMLFNGSGLASGIYMYSLQVNNKFTVRKMTLLK